MNRREFMSISAMASLSAPFSVMPAYAQSGQLNVGVTQLEKPDPIVNRWKTSRDVARQIFDSLVILERDGQVVPKLLTGWDLTEPTIWTLYLREGVRWHDGTELTAQQVADHLAGETDCCCDPANDDDPDCNENKKDCPVDQMPAFPIRVSVVDKNTVEVEFERPQPDFPRFLASPWNMMVKRDPELPDDALIGTGPYRLAEIEYGVRARLERNNDYWDELPSFEAVEFRDFGTQAGLEAALLADEVQVINELANPILAERDPRVTVEPFRERAVVLHLNLETLGGPKSELAQLLRQTVNSVVPESVPGQLGRPAIGEFGSNFYASFSGLVEPETGNSSCGASFDQPIRLAVADGANVDLSSAIARTLSEELEICGLSVSIATVPFREFLARPDQFAGVLYTQTIDVAPLGMVETYLRQNFTPFGEDFSEFSFLKARFDNTIDFEARRNLSDEVFQRFAAESPIVPLARVNDLFAFSERVEGVQFDAFGDLDLRQARLSL